MRLAQVYKGQDRCMIDTSLGQSPSTAIEGMAFVGDACVDFDRYVPMVLINAWRWH